MPLGTEKFLSETGIKQSDWFGVHWARWEDAVREAGLAPNKLQSDYDKTELLEKYAQLTRELGRIPVSGDLRLKTRSDSEFPSHNTFGRFGTKLELIGHLLAYCQARNGYEDVVRLCEAYGPRSVETSDQAESPESEIGFVYLIKSGRFFKIGRTNATGRREYELKIQLPERAMTIHTIRTDDPEGIEAYWHKRFDVKRKNGEWFELGAADVAAFKRRKFM